MVEVVSSVVDDWIDDVLEVRNRHVYFLLFMSYDGV